MIEPLTVATVGGKPLRFFRPPHSDPDFPWHAVDDLQRCLGLNRAQRKVFLRMAQEKAQKERGAARPIVRVQTVATPAGVVNIAPHFMAQGTIDAMVEVGQAPASVRAEYDDAGADAMKLLTTHLTFGTEPWFAWMKAAMRR